MEVGENRTKPDGFMLRMPNGMRERIKENAEANNRSMNAEIVERLGWSLDRAPDLEAERAQLLLIAQRQASDLELLKIASEANEGDGAVPGSLLELLSNARISTAEREALVGQIVMFRKLLSDILHGGGSIPDELRNMIISLVGSQPLHLDETFKKLFDEYTTKRVTYELIARGKI